jgi:hypothetical protein
MWGWAVISFFLAASTVGISLFLLPFFANAQYASSLRKRGYLTEKQWNERKKVRSGATSSGSKQQREASSIADEIAKLATLKDQGVPSDEEFNNQKRKLLSQQEVLELFGDRRQKSEPNRSATLRFE